MRAAILLAGAAMMFPTGAAANISALPAIQAAVAGFAVPLPANATISVDGCPEATGNVEDSACAYADGRIYLAGQLDRFTLAHELGHGYLEPLSGYWKGALVAVLGRAWENCGRNVCADELAADAYAACALRMQPPRMVGHGVRRRLTGAWESPYGYRPNRRQHQHVCDVIRRSAG